jgi:hypothetical protein
MGCTRRFEDAFSGLVRFVFHRIVDGSDGKFCLENIPNRGLILSDGRFSYGESAGECPVSE